MRLGRLYVELDTAPRTKLQVAACASLEEAGNSLANVARDVVSAAGAMGTIAVVGAVSVCAVIAGLSFTSLHLVGTPYRMIRAAKDAAASEDHYVNY